MQGQQGTVPLMGRAITMQVTALTGTMQVDHPLATVKPRTNRHHRFNPEMMRRKIRDISLQMREVRERHRHGRIDLDL
jgi:hypothetical protein